MTNMTTLLIAAVAVLVLYGIVYVAARGAKRISSSGQEIDE